MICVGCGQRFWVEERYLTVLYCHPKGMYSPWPRIVSL